MTRSELDAAVLRLFSIAKEIYSRMAIKETIVINDEKYQMDADFNAEPFKVHIKFSIYPENGITTFFSVLPYDVPPSKSSDFAKRVCNLNYNELYVGNYDYNTETGKTVFRVAIPFRDSIIAKELVEENIKYIIETVSKYNDMFFKAVSN